MTGATGYLLDLTRLVRRAAFPHPTGIDRVERAYLRHLLRDFDGSVHALVRTGRRFAVLDRKGMGLLDARLQQGGPWDAPRLRDRLLRRPGPAAAAETAARALSVDMVSMSALPAILARRLPPGTVYLNVGHTNLDDEVFDAVRAVRDSGSVVMVHDTIPLDFPALQRDGTPALFRRRMESVARHAGRVVTPSWAVAGDVARHFIPFGRVPPVTIAPPGIDIRGQAATTAPLGAATDRPWFVCLGTIEPRKNHALLLDLWEDLHATLPEARIPRLFIVGRRGWKNDAVFARLDALPSSGSTVVELGDLADDALKALVAGAAGLLQPSIAEGFGFPPHEALALGTPAVCAPLPVYRETLGNAAIYADPGDLYQWRNAVLGLAGIDGAGQGTPRDRRADYVPPTWEAHFKLALTTTC
jgi:glycosyltransferase involved in cell wall biosynthesis